MSSPKCKDLSTLITYEGTDGHSLHMHVHVWVHGRTCGYMGVHVGVWEEEGGGAWLCQVGWDKTEKSLWANRSLEKFLEPQNR